MVNALTWRTLACALLPMLAAAGGAQAQNYGYDDDRHGGRDGAEEQLVRCGGSRSGYVGVRRRLVGLGDDGGAAVPLRRLHTLQEPGKSGQCDKRVRCTGLEQLTPLGRDRLGTLDVLLEERAGIARVQAVDIHVFSFL